MILRALLLWCVLLVVAIINGAIRQGWIVPELGERLGHVVTLSIAILAVSWVTIGWLAPAPWKEAFLITRDACSESVTLVPIADTDTYCPHLKSITCSGSKFAKPVRGLVSFRREPWQTSDGFVRFGQAR